jgi:anti-sigma28 factor (negative regulator of flagellin synthesis)
MVYYGEPQETEGVGSDHGFFTLQKGKGTNRKDSFFKQMKCRERRKESGSGNPRAKPLDTSPPVRKKKVEEAKKKRQNGDYNSREVYRKIAEKLIDSFGI